MKKFIVPFKMEAFGNLLVEAENEEKAKEVLSQVSCESWDEDFSMWTIVPAGDAILDSDSKNIIFSEREVIQ